MLAFDGTPNKNRTDRNIVDNKTSNIEISLSHLENESTHGFTGVVNGNIAEGNASIPFLPIGECWQREMCTFFQIDLHHVLQVLPAENAGIPLLTRKIQGDGNCFYRTISFLISGTQDYHEVIRAYLLQHMLQHSALAEGPLLIDDMQAYIDHQGLRSWAGENEIFFMAHLLRTDICIYSSRFHGWQVHSGRVLDPNLQTLWQMLYINHPNESHYEVVLSTTVSPIDRPDVIKASHKLVKAIINDQSSNSHPSYREAMMKNSVVDELFKQTDKITKVDANKNIQNKDSHSINAPVKRKLKFSSISSKKRVQTFRTNLVDDTIVKLKK